MPIPDHVLTEALEAFCRRLIEGHPTLPTKFSWDDVDLNMQNKLKTDFLGPLHTAAEVLVRPRVIESAAELDAMPVGSVVLDGDGDPWKKRSDSLWLSGRMVEDSETVFWCGPTPDDHPTVLHEATR